MRTLFAGLLSGILLYAAPAVQAAPTLDTGTFTLAWAGGYYPDTFDMTLLSQQDGTYQIGLQGAAPLSSAWARSENYNEPMPGGDLNLNQLAGTVAAGYRITGLTLRATAYGWLTVGAPAGCPGLACQVWDGEASNLASFEWSTTQAGNQAALGGARVDNVLDAATLSSHADVALRDPFQLELNTQVGAWARAGMQTVFGDEFMYEQQFPSEAYLSLGEFVLTVQVSPVPEPGTVGMLLAGFGMIAGTAWRRRRADSYRG